MKKFIFTIIFIFIIFIPKESHCITLKEEDALSREFLSLIFKRFDIISDPFIVNYVNFIGEKIVLTLPKNPFSFRFYVINASEDNAFATPGGHIFINRGLIESMESEDAIAGILSHEIAHVICRHISKNIERSKKISVATLAGVVAGIFLGTGGASTAASAITAGSLAAGESASLAYSREDELQADQIGLIYLTNAGYSSQGILSILKKIRDKQWYDPKQMPTYLMTHPATEDRISYIASYLENHKIQKIIKTTHPNDFDRARLRTEALYSEETLSLKKFAAEVKNHPEDPMAYYGYGLILSRIGKLNEAVLQLKSALEKNAFDPYILADLGKFYFLEGKYQESQKILENSLNSLPGNIEACFFLGRSQMELQRFNDAINTFEVIIGKDKNYLQTFLFLGESYGKVGNIGNAHYNLGIYSYKKGDFRNAFFHFDKANKEKIEPEKKQLINDLLKEIKVRHEHNHSDTPP